MINLKRPNLRTRRCPQLHLDMTVSVSGSAMRIDFIEYSSAAIPRKEPFTIAKGSSTVAENVLVVVHSGSLAGHGAGAPTDVTRESLVSAMDAIKGMVRALEGFTFEKPREVADKMDKVTPGNPSVKAAIDIAIHDLVAQAAGVPVYRYLGGTRDRMATDITIGIMDTPSAVARARAFARAGFHALKIKVGRDPRGDLDRLRAIRGEVGPTIEMRVLTESSPIPIMADEMVLTADDAKKVRWANCAKAVNLKLMKHGGICRAIDVNTICESAGYPTMVGCMGEPQISIAAGLAFALAHKNVRWIDLDSHFNLAEDPSSGLRFENGELVLPSTPGLGVSLV